VIWSEAQPNRGASWHLEIHERSAPQLFSHHHRGHIRTGLFTDHPMELCARRESSEKLATMRAAIRPNRLECMQQPSTVRTRRTNVSPAPSVQQRQPFRRLADAEDTNQPTTVPFVDDQHTNPAVCPSSHRPPCVQHDPPPQRGIGRLHVRNDHESGPNLCGIDHRQLTPQAKIQRGVPRFESVTLPAPPRRVLSLPLPGKSGTHIAVNWNDTLT